jgi:hypothetical protein
MLKTAVATLGVLIASTAFAGGPQSKKATPKKDKAGGDYVCGENRDKKTLSDAQIAEAMKAHLADIDSCWQQAPDALRKKDIAAVLHLDIDDIGEIQTVELRGAAFPDDTQRCISLAATSWQFPDGDDSTQADYKLTLHAK